VLPFDFQNAASYHESLSFQQTFLTRVWRVRSIPITLTGEIQ